eukprot:Tbor_TRINITY_DN5271_c0_g2::TRINITY_DN5271_c0_g2_i1::g.16127::m.16127
MNSFSRVASHPSNNGIVSSLLTQANNTKYLTRNTKLSLARKVAYMKTDVTVPPLTYSCDSNNDNNNNIDDPIAALSLSKHSARLLKGEINLEKIKRNINYENSHKINATSGYVTQGEAHRHIILMRSVLAMLHGTSDENKTLLEPVGSCRRGAPFFNKFEIICSRSDIKLINPVEGNSIESNISPNNMSSLMTHGCLSNKSNIPTSSGAMQLITHNVCDIRDTLILSKFTRLLRSMGYVTNAKDILPSSFFTDLTVQGEQSQGAEMDLNRSIQTIQMKLNAEFHSHYRKRDFNVRDKNKEGTNNDKNHILLFPESTLRTVTVHFVPVNLFYTRLLLLTGPKSFNALLVERARRKGYSLTFRDGLVKNSRYCVGAGSPEADSHITSEKELFMILDMPYLSPENRGV